MLKSRETIKASSKRKGGGRLPLARLIIVFSIIILIINILIVVQRAQDEYDIAITRGEKNAERLMKITSDHVELTYLAVDLTLRRAVERQYFNALFGNNLREDMQNNFMAWINETPQIAAMMMTDEAGTIDVIFRKEGYKTWLEDKISVEDQNYFKALKDSDDSELLYIGLKNTWLQDTREFVVMSRQISNLDGSFGGIILAAVDSEYIVNYFNSIESDKKTRLVIFRDDLKELISQIDDRKESDTMNSIAKNAIPKPGSTEIVIASDIRSVTDESRIFVFKRIPNLHLTLAIVVSGEDIFKPWFKAREDDLIFLGVFALFVLVVSSFAMALSRQILKAQRSEAAAILASQAKSDFLAHMSHELRTPLNAIIGFSEMMEAGYFGKVNPKQKERIHDINLCGNHLLELINDILEFSKGDAGKQELLEKNISIPEVMTEVVRMLHERAKQGDVLLQYDDSVPIPELYADERKLKQIMINLVGNAVKFTPKGGKVEIQHYIEDKGNFVICVSDTGIGMDEEDIPKALSPFGQVHGNQQFGGTGLGLPLCKMYAELHGGSLSIKSVKGSGTKIFVKFPQSRVISGVHERGLQMDLPVTEPEIIKDKKQPKR